ncbi:MAG: transcriptional repressor [Firmicutes bacterium]|nr:transcriptional repressor [Bacillota bacterium]
MNQGDIRALFKRKGIKMTMQRLRVYELLNNSNVPLTADTIYFELSGSAEGEEKVNLSTVYRILEIFIKNQMVTKSNLSADFKSTFEITRSEHRHHLICVKCHLVTPLSGCPLKGYDQKVHQSTRYEILEHKLEILGICPECQHLK